MSANDKLRVVLCWHMHQPQYRDEISGEYHLPWTYLHAIKDYVDMVAHLEAEPNAHAVVNFAPILLEQLDDYAQQVQGFIRNGGTIKDPLLAALGSAALPVGCEQRLTLVKACLRANKQRLIKRFKPFARLAEMAVWFQKHPDGMMYLDDQFLVDLLVWYHLAWLGETVRRTDATVKRLQEKASGFSLKDRCELIGLMGGLLDDVIDRYRVLAQQGRVELSFTPYAHPIVPLMLDLASAREAMPDVDLPLVKEYPGGTERVHWHIKKGIETFERYFGFKPQGCWPSEGGVSEATMAVLEEYDFRWAATGESVLHNSMAKSGLSKGLSKDQVLHRPYRLPGVRTACFFRDDGLSDMVGFKFSKWHADDAVANLIHHLETIADNLGDCSNAVVSVILDGENAWEYYPENGYHFLGALYKQLANHPRLDLTTFSKALDEGVQPAELTNLVAGSWVYGTFSTWIGDKDKNRGWDMLADAKLAFDSAINGLDEKHRLAAEHQLAICEGSDWFWWFGDYNPSDTVNDFDHLFRQHLANLYRLIGKMPPDYLSHAFSRGTHAQADASDRSGVMRHGQANATDD